MENLITQNKQYYDEMLKKGRLIPFFKGDKLICFITFYLGTENDTDKFIRDNMWSIEEDNIEGDVCFIDQLLTSKAKENPRLSYEIWARFKKYIKINFPKVKNIQWNRYSNGFVKTYRKTI